MKIIVVGGVAGGASFAARMRRLNEEAEIIVLERGGYVSFANCGLPYHIGGTIQERERLLLQTPESLKSSFNLEVKIFHEVISINAEEQTVVVKNRKNNEEYSIRYDRLVLSPGASPIKPPIEGIDLSNIFTLRNVEDMDAIITHIEKTSPKRAVVIGGGFIGVEVAENLHEKNMQVSVIEMAPQLLAPLDAEMASYLHQHFQEKSVELYLENGVVSFHLEENGTRIKLKDGTELIADIIILAIGVSPEVTLAKMAGLTVERGIIVNDSFQTSDPNIFAIGDAIVVNHQISHERGLIPLASPANRQGRMLADILSGKIESYRGSVGTAILKAFDLTIAATGVNEKTLKRLGREYKKIYISENNHAGYYPNATKMVIKLLFDSTGFILGAQIVGQDGVDKRIDLLAMAMQTGVKVSELSHIELAYAPPYGSAKDAINVLGYVASNVLNNELSLCYPEDLEKLDTAKTTIIDVRERFMFRCGTLPNAINIPLSQLRERLGEINKEHDIILSCQTGKTSYFAYTLLKNLGYKVKNFSGGYQLYQSMSSEQQNRGIFSTFEKKNIEKSTPSLDELKKIDACGLNCPGPIMKLHESIAQINSGDSLVIEATDKGFYKDVQAWCTHLGHKIVSLESRDKLIRAVIQKGETLEKNDVAFTEKGQTMVVFSNELDRVLATLILANGMLSLGKPVTLFCTFWGLSVIRRPEKVKVSKGIIGKAFEMMLPRHAGKLSLSKMNFFGAGAILIQKLMKHHQVPSLESMLESFLQQGGKLVACQMSMDLMGISQEELLEGVEIGGVATYLTQAQQADLNFFI